MSDDAQFGIRITGDASSLQQATQQTGQALDSTKAKVGETTKEVEKHNVGLHSMHKLFHALNEVVPGLGMVMQAAFTPIGATISLAVFALRAFHEHMAKVNEEFKKMEEEAAKPATNRMEAWREATVRAREGLAAFSRALTDAAKSEQGFAQMTQQASALFHELNQTAMTFAEAVRQNELARLDEAHEAGLASEEHYALKRLEIEENYQRKKRELAEREEMTEILLRARKIEQAELAQPGLITAAQTAELKKTKALEDLGSLDKGGVEERRKSAAAALREFEDKIAHGHGLTMAAPELIEQFAALGPGKSQGEADRWMRSQATSASPYHTGGAAIYMEWAQRKLAAQGAEAEWRKMPGEEARRRVAADTASDEAARAERAAVDNQKFITETTGDIGDRRTRLAEHHRTNQGLGALEEDTGLHQALAKAEANRKTAERTMLNAVEHNTGFSAEVLKAYENATNIIKNLHERLRQKEGEVPRVY